MRKIIPTITLLWLLTALFSEIKFVQFHPFILLLSAPIVIGLQILWLKKLPPDTAETKDILYSTYGFILIVTATYFMGLAVKMELLPAFFHGFFAWPTLIAGLFLFTKQIKSNSHS